MTAPADDTLPADTDDPRRWITLGIVILSAFIVVLDNSVLNVAIPTILREFHTTLPSLQWVVTGYALTFATLLIIGGRLGDLYGHRRVFTIGAALFGAGSLLAALSWSVPSLVIGEALIEGIGASLMLPTTLAILSTTFRGRERATAFAAWGATAGAAAAFGPVVGGFLTTNYSWRWSFGINVIIAPLAIIGALVVMRRSPPPDRRIRIDLAGAAMIAAGMFLLVFALSEGATYGWWRPLKPFSIAGRRWWPVGAPFSIVPVIFLTAALILVTFVVVERAKERRDEGPLFEFAQLRHRSFRYGLLTTAVLAMGQFGLIFVLPVFLQDAKHLSAQTNGFWMLPTGVFVIAGAQLGARLTRRVGTTRVVQIGLVAETLGLLLVALAIRPGLTFLDLLPGFVFYGFGIGFATSQLTNVILSEISRQKSGVASGANTTVRQVGSALGIAVIGSLLSTQTISRAGDKIVAARDLSASVKTAALARLHASGAGFDIPVKGASPREVATLRRALVDGVTAGTRPALFFTVGVVFVGSLLSLLIPTAAPAPAPAKPRVSAGAEPFEAFEPIDPAAAALE
jgi:EmrB/QacA subfamily drug resistance transporter